MRSYAKDLTNTTERLAAQVTILRKKRESQNAVLKSRRQRSGKRSAIKGSFLLSTAEIRDKVIAAENETARKKALKTTTPKRKRPATPSEDEEESGEESTIDSDSSASDCIMVGRR